MGTEETTKLMQANKFQLNALKGHIHFQSYMHVLLIRVASHLQVVAEAMPAVCAACIKPAQQKMTLYEFVNFCTSDVFTTACVIYLVEVEMH